MTTELTLFDAAPIPGVHLEHRGATATGIFDPVDVLGFLVAADDWLNRWHWIVGDLFNLLQAQVVDDGQMRGEQRTLVLFVPLHLGSALTVTQSARVCRCVAPAQRTTLSWSHHVAVADMFADPDAQSEWLTWAADNDATAQQLAAAIDAVASMGQGELAGTERPPELPRPPQSTLRRFYDQLGAHGAVVWHFDGTMESLAEHDDRVRREALKAAA